MMRKCAYICILGFICSFILLASGMFSFAFGVEDASDNEEDKRSILSTGDQLNIDGYYSDWDNISHTDIYWNSGSIRLGAMIIQDARVYVHLRGSENFNGALNPMSMFLYVNDNITYQDGYPLKDNSMMMAVAEVNSNMTMGQMVGNVSVPGNYDELGVFEYDRWPKTYLGEATFTVYTTNHSPGDQCEFYMELSEIADYFDLDTNEIFSISMYFPTVGGQLLTVSGVSSGPLWGAIAAVVLAALGAGMVLIKRKKAAL